MSDSDRPVGKFEKVFTAVFSTVVDGPVNFFRERIVEPNRGEKYYYYHRKFRRVPTIDECATDDPLCYFEATQQFKRDNDLSVPTNAEGFAEFEMGLAKTPALDGYADWIVDNEILVILRQRRLECEAYEGPDARHKCQKVIKDYEDSATNWFIKYGDLGATGNVMEALMKQKHRMIWERRHGKDTMR